MKLSGNNKCVDLHLHIDGAVRPKTIFEISQKRDLRVKFSSEKEASNYMLCKEGSTLGAFLEPFKLITNAIAGNPESIAKVTRDFVEDCYEKSKLCFLEVRLCPIFWAKDDLNSEQVLKIVLDTLDESCKKYGISYSVTLAILRTSPEMAKEVLDLAQKYQVHRVTGFDIAGDDGVVSEKLSSEIHWAYDEANRIGLFRTAHAGENGNAASVRQAIENFDVSRIGHGYRVLDDPDVYALAKSRNIHFEVCPKSSLCTGSVSLVLSEHPILQFEKDGINYSINTDDPSITGHWLQDEFDLCQKIGLTSAQIEAANIRAAMATFLPPEEKEELVEHVLKRSSKNVVRLFSQE
ncbi:hypothetical protein Ciccas_007537 [Cichlidogyrus casuarinus]|uniref:Adenosine deaminase n=1 Tax=Cichlidogyrus casuarinus TaxID=1844966 RepID=A0ABD2Q2S6_9PLAT